MYTGPPTMPTNLTQSISESSSDEQEATRMFMFILGWTSSNATMVDNYIITISPPTGETSTLITSNTSIEVPLHYNQDYNISVIAMNCAGNSTPVKTNIRRGINNILILS